MLPAWTNSIQILLLLLSWRGINTTETIPTRASTVLVTRVIKNVVLKGDNHVEKIQLSKPSDLELECTWSGNEKKLPNITGFWRKDGSEIANSRVTLKLDNEQYNFKGEFSINGNNLGNYTCVFSGGTDKEAKIDFHLAAPQMGDVRDKPIVSYVGDSVVIGCKIEPAPNTWLWYRANGTEQEPINATSDPLHYQIHNEGDKTKLTVLNLTEGDSGRYLCSAVYDISASEGHVELRVITFLEPLKPFIAIVGEVIILVVLILLYETRNTQKHTNSATENGMQAGQTSKLTQEEGNGMEEHSTTRQRKV